MLTQRRSPARLSITARHQRGPTHPAPAAPWILFESILRAVIDEYVLTAIPVGSQALVERYNLGVSSATVRNILAALESTAC